MNSSCLRAALLLALLGSMPFPAAAKEEPTTAQAVGKETQDLLKALDGYTVEQREEAVRTAKSALDGLDARIDALERSVDERWDKMDKAAREKARAQLKELHAQRARAAEWYGSLKNSAGAAWGHMKKGFSDAYKALDHAWEESRKEFSSDKQ